MAKWLPISVGFALFSMFFGSGNLTFPLLAGCESGGHYWMAALGILLSGVLIPFLGSFALILFDGRGDHFFGLLGKRAYFWISLVCISLMGPFGVLARCITVAHGSLYPLFPHLSLPLFGIFFVLVLFFLTWKRTKILSILGNFLTPVLLLALGMIVVFALLKQPPIDVSFGGAGAAFAKGLLDGYQMMDLIAALFFSSFVIDQLRKGHSASIKLFGVSAYIGGALLAIVYIALVVIGALYATSLEGVLPPQLLAVIAQKALGLSCGPVVAIAMVLACLTTSVILAELFASFLREKVLKEGIGQPLAMGITLLIAFLVSTLEFSGIASFLGPILEVAYPALILFTLTAIAYRLWGVRPRRWPLFVIASISLIFYLL